MAWREKQCCAKVDDLDVRGPFPFCAPALNISILFYFLLFLHYVLLFPPFLHYVLLFPHFLHYVLRLEIQVDDVTVVQVFNLAGNRII